MSTSDGAIQRAFPRPWKVSDILHDFDIVDANGTVVARPAHGYKNLADLIVDGVNHIDHARGVAKTGFEEFQKLAADHNKLRDLVRRMADQLDGLVRFCLGSIPFSNLSPMEGTEKLQPLIQLVHEARTAVGGVK